MGPENDSPHMRLVVALGGNAILRRGDDGGIATQYKRADQAMDVIASLVADGDEVVLTHGNGPIVGNIVLRGEAARADVAPMPLYIADADSQGGIGLMLQMSLRNALRRAGVLRDVVSIVTQVVVDAGDPAFAEPSKPIGPFYDEQALAAIRELEPAWEFVEVPGCGWRRVVASPAPRRVIEAGTVRRLLEHGEVVIAAGGGGVPVLEAPDSRLTGVDAVIDKDWASALLAEQIEAYRLVILMESDAVYEGWGSRRQRRIDRLTVTEATDLAASGLLEAGSILPKVCACASFARRTGRKAVICRVEDLCEALAGEAGTRIVPD